MKSLGISLVALLMSLCAPGALSARELAVDQASIAELNEAFDAGVLTAERLTEMLLARIDAYDRNGPKLHAVITLNEQALMTARALDAERASKRPRSALHGIPIVLKDNFDTKEMPTTAGSVLLKGAQPSTDAAVVQRLRDAGAIVLAKVNLGEFASGTQSSLGGQSHNPHDLARSPGNSSGGTGVAVAAGYAPLGLGTDTGGSIRGPASANGIVGLKPTHGLLSNEGIIPLAPSFDVPGPMARSVRDLASALEVMVVPNRRSSASNASESARNYTKSLDVNSLKGARLGIVRDFMGADPEVDWVVGAALEEMRRAGATVVDIHLPKWFLTSFESAALQIYLAEFPVHIAAYLQTTGPSYPKNIDQLIERARSHASLGPNGVGPNPKRWAFFETERSGGSMTDPEYKIAHARYMPMARALIDEIMSNDDLDALVYPTHMRPPELIASASSNPPGAAISPLIVANLTGYPDLSVPAGFTTDDLPVGLSFLGPAFSEGRLLALGYSFEQRTKVLRRPVHSPAISGQTIDIPD